MGKFKFISNRFRESFYIETMGDHLMKSAHSSRLNPFHISNYRLPNLVTSSVQFAPKSKLEKLGETIMNQKSFSIPQIGMVHCLLNFV